ncbi:MAG: ATP-binding cassette domain-containing protein [Candidatus Latescibacterota bacterium]
MPAPAMSLTGFLRRVLSYLRPYRLQALLIVVAMVVDLVLGTLFRLSFKFLIDDVLGQGDRALMLVILAALTVGVAAASLIAVGRDYLCARLGTSVLNDLRFRTFEHLQRLSVGFYSRSQTGDIMARFTTDLAAVENALILALPSGLISLLGVILVAVPLYLLEWRLALLATLGLPICLIGPRLLGARASSAGYSFRREQARVASTVQQNVSAQAIVKAFSLQQSAVDQFRNQIASLFHLGVRSNFLSYLMERTPNISSLALELLVAGVGTFLAFKGAISVGSLVSFYVLFVNVGQAVYGISWVVPYLVQAASGMQRIDELLAEAPQVTDVPEARPLPRLSREIAFSRVAFGYASDHPILQDVDLVIPQGCAAAFVGTSGSGKSTVLNLVMRFYDPTAGAITFDGCDLRQASQESLRAQLGVVFQENFLFNIAVRENIRLGRQEATDEMVEQAARNAEIHDFIASLPEGYDTVVGEGGGRLSGGQRQRIALARAILRDPAILVLDEATSALDPSTEAAVNATLEHLARGRTLISVTHRLSTAVNMDRIYVLAQGRVVEQGTHKELLNLKGTYHRMWQEFALTLTQDALVGDLGEEAAVAGPEVAEPTQAAQRYRELQEEVRRQAQEIQRLQLINQRWAHLAGTDRLTGLPNKLAFIQAVMPHEIQHAQRRGEPIGFLLISGDTLGTINENYGRNAGDRVLQELARFLQAILKGEEQLGHLDGTNFAVALHPASLEQARQRAETLRSQVAERVFSCDAAQLHITVSAGATSIDSTAITDPRQAVEETLRHLGLALYEAKRAGGNRVETISQNLLPGRA